MGSVIDMNAYRAHRRVAARHACLHSTGCEEAMARAMRVGFAWQRVWIRALFWV